MSNVHYRLADIELNRSPMDEKIIGLFRFDAEGRGRRSPTLIIIAEISSTLYVYEQLLDTISQAAEQARALVSGVDSDPMARFEKLIERINQAVADFTSREPTSLSWNRVNLFILELNDGQMCLSGIGSLCNVFVQQQPDGTYRAFDIFGSLEQPADIQPNKVFASLICGDFKAGDVLFAGTTNFERLRGDLKITERLTTLPPVTAALELRNDVEARSIPDDFAGVVIAGVVPPTQPPRHTPGLLKPEEPKSTSSIKKMREDERKTQAYLSPTISPVTQAEKKDRAAFALGKGKKTLVSLFARLRELVGKAKAQTDRLAVSSLRGLNAGHGSSLTPKRKRTMYIAAGAGVVVLGGVLWLWHARAFAAEQKIWNASFDKATNDIHSAEADLLYQNDDSARRLLNEAQDILKGLDEKTADRKKAKSDLSAQLATLSAKARRELRVDQPKAFFQLPDGAPEHALRSLALSSGRLFTVDSSGSALVQVATAQGEMQRYSLPALPGSANVLTATKELVYVLTDNKGLGVYDAKNAHFAAAPFASAGSSSTAAAVAYAGKLYVLDPGGNMIWKLTASASGAGSAAKYLRQTSVSLADATGLAIDSSVYVSFKNGKLVRYLSGAEESWAPVAIEPPLASAASIWTDPDTDRLAVADPDGKRVIVYRKDGQLVAQIVSSQFKAPTGVYGDSANKKLYVLDGNTVWQVDLP